MIRALLAVLGLLSGAVETQAVEPRLETVDLFEAGVGGYTVYRIPGIVATRKGTLLAYCEARKTRKGDWDVIDILMRRSTDGGATWGPAQKIAEPPKDARKNPIAPDASSSHGFTLNNPVAIVDASGAVHFLYCLEYERCFHQRSDDDGETFSQPVEITSAFAAFRPKHPWTVLATGPGHGIPLANGRLIVPVWIAEGTKEHPHRPSAVSVVFSDDHGRTWKAGDVVASHPTPANPSETTAVELADGRVMLNIRHESAPHLRAVAVSQDGATGWSPLRYDPALPEPICFGSLVRFSRRPQADTNRLLFVNPHNPVNRTRRNLTVKLSEDEGETWPISRTIEPNLSGYADLTVTPNGTIACLFEQGPAAPGDANPRALRLARFPLDWLTADAPPRNPSIP